MVDWRRSKFPIVLVVIQVLFILIFGIFGEYGENARPINPTDSSDANNRYPCKFCFIYIINRHLELTDTS